MAENFKPHLFLKKTHTSSKFTSISRGGPSKIPKRDRSTHGEKIINDLSNIWKNYNKVVSHRKEQNLPYKKGEYFTFRSEYSLKLRSLDSDGANLLNVKYDENSKQQLATLYIPFSNRAKLIDKVKKYSNEKISKNFNNELVASISSVLISEVEYFWTGQMIFLPKENAIWCELWLNCKQKPYEKIKVDFDKICTLLSIRIGSGVIHFPETTIVNIKANYEQLNELVKSFDYIAEIRKPDELNSFWLKQNIFEREEWIDSVLSKAVFKKSNNFVSIFDTGVNNVHNLLENVLKDENKLTTNPNWGINDNNGHGTAMAGVIMYGDLNNFLEKNENIEINHELESIKIIPPKGWNLEDEDKLPLVTLNAVNIAKLTNPTFKRIYFFAICSKYNFEFGKPSTWSATIDKLIFGEDESDKKIFLVSAGNVQPKDDYTSYPEVNYNSQILNPAQSWNCISVGAYTQKVLPDNETLAKKNELSPFSRTSNAWEDRWPIKPDVVFEGGNLVKKENGDVDSNDDLEVLTTSKIGITNKLTTTSATSAATAFAANFIAQLRNVYPNAWEETLRALTIHSASWSMAMKNQVGQDGKKPTEYKIQMLRTFGYGIPNLSKAISCKANYLTFVSEEIIQPYIKEKGSEPRTNEVHFYKFPWPKETLLEMGNVDATIRVTLSYFIEPNPGEKGYSTNYSYQSAALRFAVMPPNDNPENFMLRINRAAQNELKENLGLEKKDKMPEGQIEKIKNIKWELGDNIFKGSVHSNYWKTSAANISACNYIAVHPIASGWWKNLKRQKKFNEKLRYSLVVSIETPESIESVDIYTEIAEEVKIKNLIKV